ncbi:hypothetical protein ES15_1904 [Cronobacter sakazakii ES15]|nr:hypothetical protein ES15_1904 [Cronobacter sakazakii ES15]
MHSTSVFKASGVAALLLLAGCSSSTTKPEQYSGFLKDYSGLEKTTSSTGKPVMRWVAPGFNLNNYDSIVYNPVVYYPTPKPTAQISQKVLDGLLNYTNDKLKTAAASQQAAGDDARPAQRDFPRRDHCRRQQQRRAAIL